MDENFEKDVCYILEKTGFKQFYPGKLKRQDFFQLMDIENFQSRPLKIEQVCEAFINNIKFCYTDARNLQTSRAPSHSSYLYRRSKSTALKGESLHPIDVITIVFLCCDPIARQDLSRLLWECKFSIPFIIQPEQLDPLTVYTWPLHSVKYKHQCDESCDKAVTECEFGVVSFLRLGKSKLSKSAILNTVVCQSTQEHPIFFHRDCKSSTRQRSLLTDGIIETAFASINAENTQRDLMFLNLRGDCFEHKAQRDVIFCISNVLVIILEEQNIERAVTTLEKQSDLSVLLLLSDISDDFPNLEEKLESYQSKFQQKINIDIVPILGMPKPDISEMITKFVTVFSKESKTVAQHISKAKGAVIVDENSNEYITASKKANDVLNLVKKLNDEESEPLFPLQGEPFTQWAKANRKRHRDTANECILQHRAALKQCMEQCRTQQAEIIKKDRNKDTLLVHVFLSVFLEVDVEHADLTRQLFLRYLHHGLETIYQKTVFQYQQEYKRTMYLKSNTVREDVIVGDAYSLELQQLEAKLAKNAITLSKFVKEIGQMYEALIEIPEMEKEYGHLPGVAVKLLLDGYALEIMDGNTTSVPITWVSAVLSRLMKHFEEKEKTAVKVKVVSVLGIQSSGKSTLLNTIFGSTFSVGSGRCTRGVYMHIVKVSRDKSSASNLDYVLVIDSEGISALEYKEDLSRERELATFILGLADSTIVNIMSENTIYLRDILPISVHAFLRMDLVGIEPKCAIAHQNVDPMNIHLMVKHWDDLKRTLDEYTHAACNLEGVPARRFQDIVKLDVNQDIYCFSTYRQKSGNTDVVGSGYSEMSMKLASSLISSRITGRSLNELKKFVELLWNALKKENFVYEFRNTIETEACLIADDNWCRAAWKLRQMTRKSVTNVQLNIKNSNNLDECGSRYNDGCNLVVSEIEKMSKNINLELKTMFKNTKEIYKEPIRQWRGCTMEKFKELSTSTLENAKSEILVTYQVSCKRIKLQIAESKVEQEVAEYIRHERSELQEYKADDVDVLFRKWIQKLEKDNFIDSNRERMQLTAQNTLFEAFPSYRQQISEKLERLEDYNLIQFTIDEKYFSNFSRNITDMNCRQTELAELFIENTRNRVIKYFEKRKLDGKGFDNDVFAEILTPVKQCKEIEMGRIATRKLFQIDLAVCIVSYAVQSLKDIAAENKELITDSTKKRFKLIYDSVSASDNDKLRHCLGIVREGIIQKVLEQVCDAIAEDLVQYRVLNTQVLQSKRTLLLYILIRILQKPDIKLIDGYLAHLKGSMRSWICELFDRFCEEQDNLGCRKIQDVLQRLLCPVVDRVDEVIKEMCSCHQESEEWKQAFQMSMSKYIQVENMSISLSRSETVFIKTRLIEEFSKIKESFSKGVYDQFFEENYYDHIKVMVADILLKNLTGCTESCPFCGETCMYGQPRHIGKHRALFHRPIKFFRVIDTAIGCTDCHLYIGEKDSKWESKGFIENESAWQCLASLYRSLVSQKEIDNPTDLPEIPKEFKVWKAEAEIRKLLQEFKEKDD